MKFNIVIEKDEHGYYAFCPALKGCHSQGDSPEEVLSNIKEAMELYLETLNPSPSLQPSFPHYP
ncbi:MAG: type II toxin-antitoxin system HicB family antitoxin [Candidatus Dadabacteria bacterium]|nr:type II toxin-antitoxin system HicB family antitoxin [Candidatus Dadabacteria bacterium]